MAAELHAIETKFNRCLRYIEKHLPEAERCLDQSALDETSNTILESLLEKINFLVKAIEPRIEGLQEHAVIHESKVCDLGADATDQMTNKTEALFDKISEIEDTIAKLKVRLERIRKMIDRAQMLATRLSSQEFVAVQQSAYERLERIQKEAEGDDKQISGSNLAPNQNAETSDKIAAMNAAPEQRENANRGYKSHESEARCHSLTAQQMNRKANQITEWHLNATDADQKSRNSAARAEEQTNAKKPIQQFRNPATGAEGQTIATEADQQSRNPATGAEGQANATDSQGAEGQANATDTDQQSRHQATGAEGQCNASSLDTKNRTTAGTAESEVKDEKLACAKWKIARVDQASRSADDKAGAAKVHIDKNLLTRPVNSVHPVEVPEQYDKDKEIDDNGYLETENKDTEKRRRRPSKEVKTVLRWECKEVN